VTSALCAVVLAAGAGSRLRPLTDLRPKALCPVGNVALLDRALARLAHHGLSGPAAVAVNAWHSAEQIVRHVGGRAYVSVETGPKALGTAGALANLHNWIAGRAVLVGNADAYLARRTGAAADLKALQAGWSGQTIRVLCVPVEPWQRPEFSSPDGAPLRFAGFSLLPASVVASLPHERCELVGRVWRPAEQAGRLETIGYDGCYLDTGTPADYLAANLHAAGPDSLVAPNAVVTAPVVHSVVGADAQVRGPLTRTVVWPRAIVTAEEHLVEAIRADGVTVSVRPAGR
jgi:N-acetyl-alpha-D-muramate 1-phosphate uridylyltransferase